MPQSQASAQSETTQAQSAAQMIKTELLKKKLLE
jgi:hypothetical protein